MHSQAMIHGGLRGVCLRTLVVASTLNSPFDQGQHSDQPERPRMPSGLCTSRHRLRLNKSYSLNSSADGGTVRWMSPELLDPDQFGFEDSRPTKESDCYALGMVIYEVLSGQAPFTPYKDFIVMRKVTEGERPERPRRGGGHVVHG
jgi:serine/threonine protein kinase